MRSIRRYATRVLTVKTSVGIIGVGELGRAITEGLSGLAGTCPPVWLSPRGRRAATDLAQRFDNVTVCASNREVAERTDVLLLTVRPDSLDDAVADVTLGPDSVVISAVAGATHTHLRSLLGDDCTIVRAVPMPAVRARRSVTVVYPAEPGATRLFDQLGGTIIAASEAEFAALMASTATISTFMAYLSTIVEWLVGQGIEQTEADRYVRGFFTDASAELTDASRSLGELAHNHETPGGLNQQLRETWFVPTAQELQHGLDALMARVSGGPEPTRSH